LGFDSEKDLFTPNCQAQLNAIGARITLRALQSPYVAAAGWVFGTHGDTDPAHLEKVILEALNSAYPYHGLRLGFRVRQLWNGKKKTEPAAATTTTPTPAGWPRNPGLRVAHIDCERDHESEAKAMISAVLRLPYFSSYSNLPLRLVDVLRFNSTDEERDAFLSAYNRQSNISGSLSRASSQDFLRLDAPISQAPYNGASLRRLILEMKNHKGQKIFMSINRNWNGSGHILSFPTLYKRDAQHRVSFMAKYLAMEYDDHIYDRFSNAAVAIAESMGWDDALKKPISANETTCRDIESITFSWEVSSPAVASALISRPKVNFDNLTVSSLDNPPAAQPLLSTALPTATSAPAAADDSSARTTSSTRLQIQQLQAQVQALTGAPLPTDDSSVATSMSTKELLRSLVAQVTSLSAAGIQQPMAAGTPQTPAVVSSPPGSVPTDPGRGE